MKKKYSSLRIASILLMLVLITSCVISGTFAKYTTSGSGSDSARVAKWGVVVNASGDEVVYDTILGAGNVDTKELDIVSSGSVNKIAPGTKGEFCKFEISGQPEVSVKILYTVTIEMDGWEVDGVFYCPLAISVNGRTPITGFTSEADFVEKVTKAIKACDLSVATDANAGYDLKTHSVNVKWEWAYETDEAISLKDTALATKATRPTIKIDVTCTVTQVD